VTILLNLLLGGFAAVCGVFGAAFLYLLLKQPRQLLFCVVGLTFWGLGLKNNEWARKTLIKLDTY
jgi:hypothetical protein